MGNRRIRVSLDTEHPWMFFNINVDNDQQTYQVHRVGGGINFKANRRAMKVLSPEAYMLYMCMVMDASDHEWLLDEETVASKSSLKPSDIERAVQELLEKKYLTQGEITIGGAQHKRKAFHLWENGAAHMEA